MHSLGPHHGRHTGVTLTNLLEHLPKANDPGCSAGRRAQLALNVATNGSAASRDARSYESALKTFS